MIRDRPRQLRPERMSSAVPSASEGVAKGEISLPGKPNRFGGGKFPPPLAYERRGDSRLVNSLRSCIRGIDSLRPLQQFPAVEAAELESVRVCSVLDEDDGRMPR